jgi:hypothetical protein
MDQGFLGKVLFMLKQNKGRRQSEKPTELLRLPAACRLLPAADSPPKVNRDV